MEANNGKLIEMFINHKINIIIHLFEPNNASFKKIEKKIIVKILF
jgi:hypothetical protein